jgi:hypothetical protein
LVLFEVGYDLDFFYEWLPIFIYKINAVLADCLLRCRRELLKLSPTILSVAFIMYLSYRASSGLSMGGGGGGAGAGVCEGPVQ